MSGLQPGVYVVFLLPNAFRRAEDGSGRWPGILEKFEGWGREWLLRFFDYEGAVLLDSPVQPGDIANRVECLFQGDVFQVEGDSR